MGELSHCWGWRRVPETGHWWKLQASPVLELFSLLNSIINLRRPIPTADVDLASAIITTPKHSGSL